MGEIENIYSDFGVNCVALYKVSKLLELRLPEPIIHVYMSGILDRVDGRNAASPFVVNSVSELSDIISKHSNDQQPHAVPYLFAQASGDFYFNLNSRIDRGRDLNSVASFYSVAHEFGSRLGRKLELEVFSLMVQKTKEYSDFLWSFHDYVGRHRGFSVSSEDFLSMRDFVKRKLEREKKIVMHQPILVDPDDKLILN